MITLLARLALALSVATALGTLTNSAAACDAGCAPGVAAYVVEPVSYEAFDHSPAQSWVFKRSTFTNDPLTGARVAQYDRKDPVEPLDDQRLVTSSYRRTRTDNRGRDGSIDTSYQVQAWGNGRGGIDAEWQMFNDVWKEAILSGSFYNSEQAAGPWGSGWSNGWNGGSNWGGGPGWNGGGPGWGNPGGGGNWSGGGWQGGGGWNQDNWPHHGKHKKHDHWPSDNRPPLNQDRLIP